MIAWSYFYFYFIWRDFGTFFSTVLCPFAWQPASLNILLFCVFFFPLLLKGLLSEPLKILRQHWKCLIALSTALLTEGIKKINCCGLKEIKLYLSVEGEWPMKVFEARPGSRQLSWAPGVTHTPYKLSIWESAFFYPYSSLKMLLM